MRIVVHLTDAAREYAYDRASCFFEEYGPPRATTPKTEIGSWYLYKFGNLNDCDVKANKVASV
jgi:hypothetical protein